MCVPVSLFLVALSLLPPGLFSGCGEQGLPQPWRAGFSLQWRLLLQSVGSGALGLPQLWYQGSVVMAPGLWSTDSVVVVHGLLLLACGDPSGSGIEPMSPVLAGRFFTTEPPGKPHIFLNCQFILILPNQIQHQWIFTSCHSLLNLFSPTLRIMVSVSSVCVCTHAYVCLCVFYIPLQLLFMTL